MQEKPGAFFGVVWSVVLTVLIGMNPAYGRTTDGLLLSACYAYGEHPARRTDMPHRMPNKFLSPLTYRGAAVSGGAGGGAPPAQASPIPVSSMATCWNRTACLSASSRAVSRSVERVPEAVWHT
jgi:hypothetical protein